MSTLPFSKSRLAAFAALLSLLVLATVWVLAFNLAMADLLWLIVPQYVVWSTIALGGFLVNSGIAKDLKQTPWRWRSARILLYIPVFVVLFWGFLGLSFDSQLLWLTTTVVLLSGSLWAGLLYVSAKEARGLVSWVATELVGGASVIIASFNVGEMVRPGSAGLVAGDAFLISLNIGVLALAPLALVFEDARF